MWSDFINILCSKVSNQDSEETKRREIKRNPKVKTDEQEQEMKGEKEVREVDKTKEKVRRK